MILYELMSFKHIIFYVFIYDVCARLYLPDNRLQSNSVFSMPWLISTHKSNMLRFTLTAAGEKRFYS